MAKTGESYAKACEHELMDHPGLYTRYEAEKANGSTFLTPEYVGSEFVNGDGHSEEDSVDDHSMYGRRAQSTTNNDMTDQERKNKGKMRR